MMKSHSPKKNMIDVSAFRPIIVNRARAHYWRLPDAYKASIGLDDCIQDVLVHLHRVLNRLGGRKAKYDPSKAKDTTWIYSIVDNYFQGYSVKYLRDKRRVLMTSVDELRESAVVAPYKLSLTELREAREKTYEVNKQLPPEVRDFVAKAFYSDIRVSKNVIHGQAFKRYRAIFQETCRRVGCTYEHYKLALDHELEMAWA